MTNRVSVTVLLCAALFVGWLLGVARADAQEGCPVCPPCPAAEPLTKEAQLAIDAARAAIDAANAPPPAK